MTTVANVRPRARFAISLGPGVGSGTEQSFLGLGFYKKLGGSIMQSPGVVDMVQDTVTEIRPEPTNPSNRDAASEHSDSIHRGVSRGGGRRDAGHASPLSCREIE